MIQLSLLALRQGALSIARLPSAPPTIPFDNKVTGWNGWSWWGCKKVFLQVVVFGVVAGVGVSVVVGFGVGVGVGGCVGVGVGVGAGGGGGRGAI